MDQFSGIRQWISIMAEFRYILKALRSAAIDTTPKSPNIHPNPLSLVHLFPSRKTGSFAPKNIVSNVVTTEVVSNITPAAPPKYATTTSNTNKKTSIYKVQHTYTHMILLHQYYSPKFVGT